MANMSNESSDYTRAHKLLDIYHGEVDDFFKLWPADKNYFFCSDKKAFIAYGVKTKVAVCMGDPVGRDKSIKLVLSEFKSYCSKRGWIMAFIQTSDKCSEAYLLAGLKSILIGADAVIDLDNFVNNTIHNKYFRNIVNRFEKQEFKVMTHIPPHDVKLLKELKVISNSWLKLPHRKEWSFLTGKFDNNYLQQVTVHVLRDKDGLAHAFVNEIPSFKPGVSTIDLMRHHVDAPPNSMDFLFISLIRNNQLDGYTSFNLGVSPLDGKYFANNMLDKILEDLFKASNRFIGFKGLHQFKAKYEPDWDPRYVWYQGGLLRLPQIGLAVYELLKAPSKNTPSRGTS